MADGAMAVTFRHEAMATTFAIAIADRPEAYARQAAAAAFRELDRLEGELSRFIESSDIGRANRLRYGDTIAIGDDALECLVLAAEVRQATSGAFDAAFASEWPAGAARDTPCFVVDPAAHMLTSHAQRLHLDLGAIGKGYALDRLAAVLSDWGIASARLESGGSTVLALAPPPDAAGWPVSLGDGSARRDVALCRAALSASGVAVQGRHLIDPRTGAPARRLTRAWSLADTAARADALSTAFFVFDDAEVDHFCRADPAIGAMLASSDGTLRCYGRAADLFRPSGPGGVLVA